MNNYIKPRTRRTVQRSDIALEMSSRRMHTLPVSIWKTGGELDYPTELKPPTPPQLHVSETNILLLGGREGHAPQPKKR